MYSLSGKHILVTGASSGIGREIAITASNYGANVTIFGRDQERLNKTLSLLSKEKHKALKCDLTDFKHIKDFLIDAISFNGPVDGFVHCAGIEKTLPIKYTTYSIFQEIFEINVYAGFEIARILSVKGNYRSDGASFLFLSSIAAKTGGVGKLAYSASKAALLTGVKVIAMELSSKKIRCNSILPGIVQTGLVDNLFQSIPTEAKEKIISDHPLGLGDPADIANLACFLLSEKSRWITGSEFIIDGGYNLRK